MTARLGVDIGGTFTDVVLEQGERRATTKVLTTYSTPENAIIEGMHKVCDQLGMQPSDITQIIHGTTLATNALIERRGAKTALITTDGFSDVIEMRSESRFEQYDLNLVLPEPLLPRNRRYVVRERMDAQGNVLIPLDEPSVIELAHHLAKADYQSVAVGLLHSYVNSAHERQVGEILARHLPGVSVSLSSDVSPQMREYERFNTTIANAYIKPLIESYLSRLRDRLATEGAHCPVFLVHSGGGIMSLESAAQFPVRLVESGPAGGAIFAADMAARHGLDRVLSYDMGGTTAKICLIRDQTPDTARVFEVARSYRFKKGSGMPISIPVIDMVEIGAGGGSLAHVDGLSQIRVGPESAGSEPGPACFGRGGRRPAVTDADAVLGKIDPDDFAGGSFRLDMESATTALKSELGAPLNMDAIEAAWGIAEVVDENMANAARVHAVENGEDLSTYTMIAFGGAAPLHAARLCQKLGIERCLIPQGAGVGSAIGFLRAPFSFEANRSVFTRLSELDSANLVEVLEELTIEATSFVRSCDADAPITADYKAYMRYAGQGWEIAVSLPRNIIKSPDPSEILARFEQEYVALFGRKVEGLEVEITVWSVNASTPVTPVEVLTPMIETQNLENAGVRQLFDTSTGVFKDAKLLARTDLIAGAVVQGPAVVTEEDTTLVAPTGFDVAALGDGTLDLHIRKDI